MDIFFKYIESFDRGSNLEVRDAGSDSFLSLLT